MSTVALLRGSASSCPYKTVAHAGHRSWLHCHYFTAPSCLHTDNDVNPARLKVLSSSVLLLLYKPADRLSWGLPWGAAGLPGRQIPQRGERSVGVAARWDPDPAVDVLLHSTLLRTRRETAAYDRERGEAWIHQICRGECVFANALARVSPLPAKKLVFLFQLLQAFYRQQDEIRGLTEQLNHKDVSIQTHTHTQGDSQHVYIIL